MLSSLLVQIYHAFMCRGCWAGYFFAKIISTNSLTSFYQGNSFKIDIAEDRFYNPKLPFNYIKWPWRDSNSRPQGCETKMILSSQATRKTRLQLYVLLVEICLLKRHERVREVWKWTILSIYHHTIKIPIIK